ncbi:HNH endonuclease [Burkholderia multivorans]|nr:HNH endonuclease [Burkholderia multivorans]
MKTKSLTAERLRELLAYDPVTGKFTWRMRPSNRVHVGDEAGHVGGNGYVQIRVDGAMYQAHRLAWLYVTGRWPVRFLDHRDLDRSNNRFVNLREANDEQNAANSPRRRHGHVGLKGVGYHRSTGRYRARIRRGNREYHLGLFDTPEAAHRAYQEASRRLHGEFGRVN